MISEIQSALRHWAIHRWARAYRTDPVLRRLKAISARYRGEVARHAPSAATLAEMRALRHGILAGGK